MSDQENTPKIPNVFDPTCPARHVLELISNKWSILIMFALEGQPMRNGALLRKIHDISQKMLTQTLKDLERNGLVKRVDLKTVPLHVEYELTDVGLSLSQALVVLDCWAEKNFPALVAARGRYDRAAGGAVDGAGHGEVSP